MTKKKIEYSKPNFQWKEDKTSDIRTGDTEKDVQLKDLVDDVNSTQKEKEVSPIAKSRRIQKKEMENIMLNLQTEIEGDVINSKEDAEKLGVIENAVKSIDFDIFEKNDEAVIVSGLATSIGNIDLEDVVDNKEERSVVKERKVKIESNDTEKNTTTNWKSAIVPLFCLGFLMVIILVAIQWSKNSNQNLNSGSTGEQVQETVDVKKNTSKEAGVNNKKIEKDSVVETKDGLLINNDLAVQNNNNQNKVSLGSAISVPGQNSVPVVQFVSTNEKVLKVDEPLSINKIQPINGANGLAPLSLAQWPNSINLKELSKDFLQVESLFPKNIYRKKESFDGKDILTIYDKRSVVQEKFVKENQTCYFIPTELGKSWLGVNYFLLSYCFLDNQFIGVNMYANAESDMIKTLENNIKKVPYYHISSTYQGNGYTLVSIEQNNAYKILEDFRVLMLNKAVSR